MTNDARRWLEWLARIGYAARGFVYVSLGVFALLAALELKAEAGGNADVIAMVSGWPLGQVWLAAIAVGLAGFALWRVFQSVYDADGQGGEPKALASRAGQALSGLTYAALAFTVYRALRHIGSGAAEAGGSESAARILSLPLGGALLVIAGLFVTGLGVAGLVRAFKGGFCKKLSCPADMRKTAEWMGRIGYGGRGIAFLPVGIFLVRAGFEENASRARSFSEGLQTLEGQPFGSALLLLVAAGLIAFGLFAFIEGRHRQIRVPDPTRPPIPSPARGSGRLKAKRT